MNKSFELHKVAQEIKRHGSEFVVKRMKVNEYEEPTGELEEITIFCGLFHTVKSYRTKNVSDGTNTRTKGQPMVMTKYSDVLDVKNDDVVQYNGRSYRISDINNIEQMNIIADISLELIIDGNI